MVSATLVVFLMRLLGMCRRPPYHQRATSGNVSWRVRGLAGPELTRPRGVGVEWAGTLCYVDI